MFCSDVKASAALRRSVAAVGTVWGASKPRGLNKGKKQAGALRGTAVTGAQAPREGFTEITSGRSRRQQGLVATCRDSTNEA